MAFKGNESEKSVIVQRKLFTGLANWKLVAINPTEKEREVLGITQKVSDYQGTDKDGNKQTRVDLWLQLVTVPYPQEGLVKEDVLNLNLQKISIFVSDKTIESSAGNKYRINKVGMTTWITQEEIQDNPEMEWFDATDLRLVLPGEEQLTNFLIALLNVDIREEGAECRLVDPKKIANGNVKELKDIAKGWPDNTVQCLLTIKKVGRSKFQDFYKEFFARSTSKINTLEAWKNALEDDRRGLTSKTYEDHIVQGLKFSEYIPDADMGIGEQSSSSTDQELPSTEGNAPPF